MLDRRSMLMQSSTVALIAAIGWPRGAAFGRTVPGTPGMIVHRGMPLNAEPSRPVAAAEGRVGSDRPGTRRPVAGC